MTMLLDGLMPEFGNPDESHARISRVVIRSAYNGWVWSAGHDVDELRLTSAGQSARRQRDVEIDEVLVGSAEPLRLAAP
jgi:hypothetical protein